MQSFKLLFITLFSFGFIFATAQTKKESLKVWGNCGMCKGRIENAAKAAGASTASWNTETQILSVSYNAATKSLSAIEAKVASAGHDTKNKTAPEAAYKALHGCCQYDRRQASASATSCCLPGATCCTTETACCAKSKSALTPSAKDCCIEGGACCGSKSCCSKSAAITASAKDCCTFGSACCIKGASCCAQTAITTAPTTDCCVDGASCCAGGQVCCTKV